MSNLNCVRPDRPDSIIYPGTIGNGAITGKLGIYVASNTVDLIRMPVNIGIQNVCFESINYLQYDVDNTMRRQGSK